MWKQIQIENWQWQCVVEADIESGRGRRQISWRSVYSSAAAEANADTNTDTNLDTNTDTKSDTNTEKCEYKSKLKAGVSVSVF